MTRLLVVHHDVDLSDQEVDALRRRGYDARQCMGPIGAARGGTAPPSRWWGAADPTCPGRSAAPPVDPVCPGVVAALPVVAAGLVNCPFRPLARVA